VPRHRVLAFLSNILLHECGYHVLLFNSRGVGRSSGWPSLTGLTEGKDLEELVQWGLCVVPNVKSVVLVVRAVIILADDISPWPLGLLTRSSYHVSAPCPPCTDQNLAFVTLVPFGTEVSLDRIPRGDLHRSSEQTHQRPSVKRPRRSWGSG